jgi:hypothetical protein
MAKHCIESFPRELVEAMRELKRLRAREQKRLQADGDRIAALTATRTKDHIEWI